MQQNFGAVEQPVHGERGEIVVGGHGVDELVVEREGIADDDETHGAAVGGDAFDVSLLGGGDERERAGVVGVGVAVGDAVADFAGFGAVLAGGGEDVHLGRVGAGVGGGGGFADGAGQDEAEAEVGVVGHQRFHDGMGAVDAGGEEVVAGGRILGVEDHVGGDADAEVGEEFFKAGLAAAGVGQVADEGEEAAALLEETADLFQLGVGKGQARAGDDEELAVGGNVVGAEQGKFFPLCVAAFGEDGGEFAVAVRVVGFLGVVLAVAGVVLGVIAVGALLSQVLDVDLVRWVLGVLAGLLRYALDGVAYLIGWAGAGLRTC